AKLLRKNVGHADLLSVGPAKEEEKKEKKAAENKNEVPVVPLVWGSIPYAYNYPVYEIRDSGYDPGCSIM
ncbi:hypothetical protein, partial [Klebsiella pneumoniae]|uniref:hypothetical protein n=1 Tax=Klebsiella pneumoniae TaxID=573 RepID=UPI003013ABD2